MYQYWIEEGSFKIEEQHLGCQVRSILKIKRFSEVEIETLRQNLATLQEPVDVLVENDPVKCSYVTPQHGIGVEQNHPDDDGK